MHIAAFSHSKHRDPVIPGEDTILLLPGIAGVFDGATDPFGESIDGKTPGRLASQTVAKACARIFSIPENFNMPLVDLMRDLSSAIAAKAARHDYSGRPATTLALAVVGTDALRLVVVGDSGIRLNGHEVLRHNKPIDAISTTARIAVFKALKRRQEDRDRVEMDTRQIIFQGLEKSVHDGLISTDEMNAVMQHTLLQCAWVAADDVVSAFLREGIQSQMKYGNAGGHALGFSTLDGTPALLSDVIDVVRPLADVRSIEIFSDGYFRIPEHPGVSAWENTHRTSEQIDYHKIDRIPNVKGSTSSEFSDDRSIIVINR